MFIASIAAMIMQASQPTSCSGLDPLDERWAKCLQRIIDETKAQPNSGTILFRELGEFKGKPEQFAFDRLGYPDRQLKVAGRTVYIWEKTEPDGLKCVVKVITERARVVDTDFNGNAGPCAYFARRLDPTYHGKY